MCSVLRAALYVAAGFGGFVYGTKFHDKEHPFRRYGYAVTPKS